jgi:hypothetical protein
MRITVVAALAGLAACAHQPGAVGLRPDGTPGPEPCPQAALDAMDLIRVHPGDSAWIDLDLNQRDQHNISVNDGPIEGQLREPLGYILDTTTRIYGKVWTSGPHVVIRYYEARPLDMGKVVPICAVARLDAGQLKKKPGPAPGSAILTFPMARLYIVDEFR